MLDYLTQSSPPTKSCKTQQIKKHMPETSDKRLSNKEKRSLGQRHGDATKWLNVLRMLSLEGSGCKSTIAFLY